jgi:AmiR/NasT family two-component response regulator
VLEQGSRLGEAMKSRAAIEQAERILVEAQRCGPDEAFHLLRRASPRENVKLREIARLVVDNVVTGGTDPADGPSAR